MRKFLKTRIAFTAIAIALLPTSGFAESQEFSTASYDEAKKAESFLRFDMASTKVGLFTSHFSGYVKKFSARGETKENTIVDAAVEFAVKDLDTDIDGRNEKMWEHCLDVSHNPMIRIKLDQAITIDGSEKNIPAVINLRGEDHPVTLNVKTSREDAQIAIDIKGQISIKGFKIPDPSIVVASVRDTIDVSGHLIIKKK